MNIFSRSLRSSRYALKAIIGLYLPSKWMVVNQQHRQYNEIKDGHASPAIDSYGVLFRQYYVWYEDAEKEYQAWIGMGGYDTSIWKRVKGEWKLSKNYDVITKVITDERERLI